VQFSLQAASPETFGYTLVFSSPSLFHFFKSKYLCQPFILKRHPQSIQVVVFRIATPCRISCIYRCHSPEDHGLNAYRRESLQPCALNLCSSVTGIGRASRQCKTKATFNRNNANDNWSIGVVRQSFACRFCKAWCVCVPQMFLPFNSFHGKSDWCCVSLRDALCLWASVYGAYWLLHLPGARCVVTIYSRGNLQEQKKILTNK
jgi:hypothetical protein